MDEAIREAVHYVTEALDRGYAAEKELIKGKHPDFLQSLNERYGFYRCELLQLVKAIKENK